MSQAGTRVTTQKMRQVADQVETYARDFVQRVNDLYNVGQQLDSMWDGDASQRFMTQLGTDRERFEAMNRVLLQYVEALRSNAASYDNAEARAMETLNTNSIRRI